MGGEEGKDAYADSVSELQSVRHMDSKEGAAAMRMIWWGGWPWQRRFYYVRRSHWGPFAELLLGPIALVWPVDEGNWNVG
jgi:hypothetical protein